MLDVPRPSWVFLAIGGCPLPGRLVHSELTAGTGAVGYGRVGREHSYFRGARSQEESVGRILAFLALLTVAGHLSVAQDKPNQPRDDTKLLQGVWSWDPDAKQSEAKPLVLLERVVIKDAKLTFYYKLDGKPITSETTFKLDQKAFPRAIDFTPTEGANKGKTYLGLYELKDGRLKICYRGPGSTRPKNFLDRSQGTNVTTFIVLKPTPVA